MEIQRKLSLTLCSKTLQWGYLSVPISPSLGTAIDIHIGMFAVARCELYLKFKMSLHRGEIAILGIQCSWVLGGKSTSWSNKESVLWKSYVEQRFSLSVSMTHPVTHYNPLTLGFIFFSNVQRSPLISNDLIWGYLFFLKRTNPCLSLFGLRNKIL